MKMLLLYFLVYSFLGWALESIYACIKHKRLTSRRGVSTRFFLPLYGLCSVMIIAIYNLFPERLFLSAFLSAGAITIAEYIVGRWTYEAKGVRLWDYRKAKYHINGYVCLSFSVVWTFLALFVGAFFHPLVIEPIFSLGSTFQMSIIAILFVGIMVDYYFTKQAPLVNQL